MVGCDGDCGGSSSEDEEESPPGTGVPDPDIAGEGTGKNGDGF